MSEYKDFISYSDKFVTTKEKLLQTLNKYGAAVINNVLNVDEVVKFRELYLSELGELTGIKIDDTTTYKKIHDFYPMHSMLIQHFKVGHLKTTWKLRQMNKIVDIFANIYQCKTKDLLVSFDGLSWAMPHEITKRGYYRGNKWLHTDQRGGIKGYPVLKGEVHCIQGLLNLYPVRQGDATTSFLEKSHLLHDEFIGEDLKSDWYKLSDEEIEWYRKKGCKQYNLTGTAGSMFFWYSKTIHQGIEALKKRKESNFRLAIYLCYVPRKGVDKKVIVKKIKAFKELRTTSHWPDRPKLFSKNPRTYGGKLPSITYNPRPVLNNLGLRLIGIKKLKIENFNEFSLVEYDGDKWKLVEK
jgi:hypothetical protein